VEKIRRWDDVWLEELRIRPRKVGKKVKPLVAGRKIISTC